MNLDDALQTFITEGSELLRDMEAALLECEQGPVSAETVNTIFRAAHTIKHPFQDRIRAKPDRFFRLAPRSATRDRKFDRLAPNSGGSQTDGRVAEAVFGTSSSGCDGAARVAASHQRGVGEPGLRGPQQDSVHANPYFCELSGYTEKEALGQAHNFIRHPDMAPEAFADLWSTLKQGRPWRGIVKNRTKSGDFYWVEANAVPLSENGAVVGFMSVRTKPSRTQIEAADAAYRLFREGKAGKLTIRDGAVVKKPRWGVADRLPALTVKSRLASVIVLDIEMPRMDGLTFLRRIMAERPTPVVICSSLTERGASTTVEALAAGAVSIVTKPTVGLKRFLEDASNQLVEAVKAAAQANVKHCKARAVAAKAVPPRLTADAVLAPSGPRALDRTTERVVALGTSTGGTHALEEVLTRLPRGCPGIVIVQHMPEKFTAAFAARVDGLCEITVREACAGERLLPGHALIAPGGRHLMLRRSGAYYYADVVDGPLVNRHKPSVDVLFRSVAQCAGANALGVIMTGMGDDGAAGLLEMRSSGATTLGQDERSCVVYGMPKEALKRGAVMREVALESIPREILRFGEAAGSPTMTPAAPVRLAP